MKISPITLCTGRVRAMLALWFVQTPPGFWRRRMKNASPIKTEAVWVALGSIAFALCFGYPILRHLTRGDVPKFSYSDWDYGLSLHWISFHTITHFHQFPFWDPYRCGGMPLFGNPQSSVLTPFLLLHLLFGPVIGLRLEFVSHIAIAFGGAYFIARVLGISRLGAVACAGLFAGSSWYYLHTEIGHYVFMPYAYLPWAAALLCLGLERRRLTPAALGGLVMALMLTEGGVYALLHTALLLALLAPMIALQRRSFFPLMVLAVMGAFTVGFGAIKLLPGLAFTGVYARLWPPNQVNHLPLLWFELFSRVQSPTRFGNHIYDAYIGVLFAGLALLGIVLQFRRALIWAILAFALLLLVAGGFGPYSPWVLIHKLPFFASTRVPVRLLLPFTLVVGVLAGFGTDAIRAMAKPWGARIAVLLIGLALIDCWSVSTRYLHYVVKGHDAALSPSPVFHQWRNQYLHHHMFMAAKANIGVLSCYEPVRPPRYPLGFDQPDYQGEQYLLGAGTVTLERWTPNALSFDIDAPAPTMMVVNQNYEPGWRVAQGAGTLAANNGLIAVQLPAGKQRLELVYRSQHFLIGLSITLVTFMAMLLLWGYERWRAHSSTASPAS